MLHLSKFYPPHRGGIERYVELLAKAQTRAGMNVAVLAHASARQPRKHRVWRDDGVLVLESRTAFEWAYTPFSPSWLLRLIALLRRFRPDLLHLHLPNPWAFLLLLSPMARRLPWIAHWHADVPDASGSLTMRLALPLYRRFEERLLRRCAAIIATSASYAESSLQLARHTCKVRVIPLAVGAAKPATSGPDWPGTGLKLLAVGRLTYYKGLEVLLDALVRTTDCSLLIVGEGEERRALQRRISELQLGGRVALMGNLDDAELDAVYRGADVLCLASLDRAEAFGLVLLEAMRAGKPCIASRVPGSGMTEVVQDQITGLLVQPGSADELAYAIARLRDNSALRDALGEAGRQRWEASYRIESSATAINECYQAVLDQP